MYLSAPKSPRHNQTHSICSTKTKQRTKRSISKLNNHKKPLIAVNRTKSHRNLLFCFLSNDVTLLCSSLSSVIDPTVSPAPISRPAQRKVMYRGCAVVLLTHAGSVQCRKATTIESFASRPNRNKVKLSTNEQDVRKIAVTK